MFGIDELNKRVSDAIKESDIPSHHNKAFVLAVTATGVKGIITFKVKDNWQVDSMFSTDYHGEMEAGILVKGSWR